MDVRLEVVVDREVVGIVGVCVDAKGFWRGSGVDLWGVRSACGVVDGKRLLLGLRSKGGLMVENRTREAGVTTKTATVYEGDEDTFDVTGNVQQFSLSLYRCGRQELELYTNDR